MYLGITNWRFKKSHFQSALLLTAREERDSPQDANHKHSLPGWEQVAQRSYCRAENAQFWRCFLTSWRTLSFIVQTDHPSEQCPRQTQPRKQPRAHPHPCRWSVQTRAGTCSLLLSARAGGCPGRGAGKLATGLLWSTPHTAWPPGDICCLCEQCSILQFNFLGTVNKLNSLVIHLRDLPSSKVLISVIR